MRSAAQMLIWGFTPYALYLVYQIALWDDFRLIGAPYVLATVLPAQCVAFLIWVAVLVCAAGRTHDQDAARGMADALKVGERFAFVPALLLLAYSLTVWLEVGLGMNLYHAAYIRKTSGAQATEMLYAISILIYVLHVRRNLRSIQTPASRREHRILLCSIALAFLGTVAPLIDHFTHMEVFARPGGSRLEDWISHFLRTWVPFFVCVTCSGLLIARHVCADRAEKVGDANSRLSPALIAKTGRTLMSAGLALVPVALAAEIWSKWASFGPRTYLIIGYKIPLTCFLTLLVLASWLGTPFLRRRFEERSAQSGWRLLGRVCGVLAVVTLASAYTRLY